MTFACENLSVRLGRRPVLVDVDMAAAPGEWLGVIGPNGSGKSTLVRALAGLIPSTGSIRLDGRELGDLSRGARAKLIAVVPQHPVIPPGVGVADYVLLGRVPHQGFALGASEEDRRVVTAVLQRLDLEDLAGRPVEQLSGGERQRVVVARALAQETPILLLDEPTTSLDIGHQLEVLELVDDLRAEQGLTVLTTIHDLGLAGQFVDRLVLLVDGRVAAAGPPETVLQEATLERHYGARVEVITDDGGVTVIVRRRKESA